MGRGNWGNIMNEASDGTNVALGGSWSRTGGVRGAITKIVLAQLMEDVQSASLGKEQSRWARPAVQKC